MNDHKKYMGKKRQKIFSIEKIYPKRTPKNLPKQKIKLSQISHLFATKTKESQTSFKLNSNFEESHEKLTSENQRHSLISISKLVFEYLKQTENTTGNEVTEHIKNVLQPKKNDQSNQKNIQRRVYDAINVICAAGLIKKNKQEIQFLKKGKNDVHNIININNNINNINNINEKNNIKIEIKEESADPEEKIKKKMTELIERRKNLIKGFLTLKFYEKYNTLNKNCLQRKNQKKLEFPFDIIIYDNSSPIKIASKDDLTRYLILSNSGFIHLSPYDIVKNLMSNDIITELNEINNNNDNNLNQNKSNSKKSTNDESLLDDLNLYNNLNNSFDINEEQEQEEKKVEEDPKKIKILKDSFNNYSCIIPNETKISNNKEKEDLLLLIFNYLKHLKIFKEELISNGSNQCNHFGLINNDNNENCKEENEDNFEKDNNNSFNENRFRKNSNISSYASNLYEENNMKQNRGDRGDCMSEMGLFNIN